MSSPSLQEPGSKSKPASLTSIWLNEQLPRLRETLQRIDPSQRHYVNDLWSKICPTVQLLEGKLIAANEKVESLQRELSQFRHHQTPVTRPSTPESVLQIRAVIDDQIYQQATLSAASGTVDAIFDIDPAYCSQALLHTPHTTTKLGCWQNHSGDEAHYVKKNWRNTNHPNRPHGEKIGVQPTLHQIAAVASGYGTELRLTSNGEYHVSHLCHNRRCFNPDHVVIELATMNQKRKVCQGAFIQKVYEREDWKVPVMIYNPCTHGYEGRHLFCILPSKKMQLGYYWEIGPSGEPDYRREIEQEDNQD